MGLFVTFLIPLLVLTELVQQGSTEWNIVRGSYQTSKMRLKFRSMRRFPPFELCKLGPEPNQITLIVKVVKRDMRGKDLFLRIEALKPGKKHFASFEKFEVENSNMSPADLMEGQESYREVIKKKGICSSFKLESLTINDLTYHVIKYKYNGDEWCAVYATNGYTYKETGLCTDVFENFDLKKTKLSVAIPQDADYGPMWTPCKDEKPVKICDKMEHYEIKALPLCGSTSMKWNIIVYYNGYSLGTYKITNPPQPKKEDLPKFCKLFRFKLMPEKKETIGVQFFNRGDWVCELFERKFHYNNPAYIYTRWYLTKKCERFDYSGKIKPVNKWYKPMGKHQTEVNG